MNNKEWKEYLDNTNKVCKYYGEFAKCIQQKFDPYFGTGIADGEEYNLPQFSVKLSASRRSDCIGYLNIYAKDEEQVRNIIKQRKYDYDDIDWCEEDCWDYEDIEIESISLLTDLE